MSSPQAVGREGRNKYNERKKERTEWNRDIDGERGQQKTRECENAKIGRVIRQAINIKYSKKNSYVKEEKEKEIVYISF